MASAPYSVRQIADYFLVRGAEWNGFITHLKLQKLCYYAQGFYTALRRGIDPPLFREPLIARMNGPVVSDLYDRYCPTGDRHPRGPLPVPDDFDLESIDSTDRHFLDRVLETMIEYPAVDLANATKLESPWIEANAKRKYTSSDGEITLNSLFTLFRTRLGKLNSDEAHAPRSKEHKEQYANPPEAGE